MGFRSSRPGISNVPTFHLELRAASGKYRSPIPKEPLNRKALTQKPHLCMIPLLQLTSVQATTLCQYSHLMRERSPSPRSPSSFRNRAQWLPTPTVSAQPSWRGAFLRLGQKKLQPLPNGWQSSATQMLWTIWAGPNWANPWGFQWDPSLPWVWMISRWGTTTNSISCC